MIDDDRIDYRRKPRDVIAAPTLIDMDGFYLRQPLAPSYWAYEWLPEPAVYFIQAACGPIKIGVSVSPWARLHMMQAQSPSALELVAVCPGGQPRERRYHERFAHLRSHGEWFHPGEDLMKEMRKQAMRGLPPRIGSLATSSPCPE